MSLFNTQRFIWTRNEQGVAVRFGSQKRYQRALDGKASEDERLALVKMQMLTEQGLAEAKPVDGGFFIAADDAVRLDEETREYFELPPPWPGGMRLQTESVPQLASFRARLGLHDPGSGIRWEWKLVGAILEVGSSQYLPSAAQYAALLSFQTWSASSAKDEISNLSMLATLREARAAGCLIELSAYDATSVVNANEISIDVREDDDGALILRPLPSGDFPGIDPNDVEKRYGQAAVAGTRMLLRVGQTIVLMDENKTAQFKAIAERGKVSKSEIPKFALNPAAWLADHVFPDVALEFSPRVTGIGYWTNAYAGSMWDEGEDWFGKKPSGGGNRPGPGPGPNDGPVVPLIITNDSVLEYGGASSWNATEMTEAEFEPNFQGFARSPLDHQKVAVRWMMRHGRRALNKRVPTEGTKAVGAGALFADDMGLGKTFSVLMFLREWLKLWKLDTAANAPAVLVVAPLSLLENWKSEMNKSYGNGEINTIFNRVLVAQGDADLGLVKRGAGAVDKAVPGEIQEFGLHSGDGTPRSLDMPGSFVLTTYQTLRDYRFSFAAATWSAVIFDEAQNIKNPNALQTIASKSLKAILRITMTGTPVENHLGDFWSILDASEPGPLGSFSEFSKNWVAPMRAASLSDKIQEVGRELREKIGLLMLRRTKLEELADALPVKTGHNIAIRIEMTAEQAAAYDAVLASVQGVDERAETRVSAANQQLAALWQIRQVSLHQDLLGDGQISNANNEHEARAILSKSGKLKWLLQTLDAIRAKKEKALVFCVQKKLQQALAQHLGTIYGVAIPVINGDTKASSKSNSENTRLGLIDQFSETDGFGVCVLSPIAAGAGLNIVAANHVIHLERHWNPAKEDQATDRAYRIGQKKPVHVYLPAATYPSSEVTAFDEVLHRLIERKRGLQGALGLVPMQQINGGELIDGVFSSQLVTDDEEWLGMHDVARMQWQIFEALIALLYERNADRVILTPGGGDHGCDVVVLGWQGSVTSNLLVQCKSTSRNELDSEVAVREVEGARPFYENALGIKFNERVLHTNAPQLSKKTQRAATISGVTVRSRIWIEQQLKKTPVKLSQLLARERIREKV
jgi:superfamily II DNA or RNA helicase